MTEMEFMIGMLKDMAQELSEMKRNLKELSEVKLELMRLRNETRERGISSKFLTMAEACDYLKVSRCTMTKRLSDGEITFATKRGKSWLFPEDKLKAYASGMA